MEHEEASVRSGLLYCGDRGDMTEAEVVVSHRQWSCVHLADLHHVAETLHKVGLMLHWQTRAIDTTYKYEAIIIVDRRWADSELNALR